jgi:thioredoxin-dependent peroxiredoxin
MATITLGGNTIHTNGNLPAVGNTAPDFKLVKSDLSEVSLADFKGKRVILNIFPSLDTSVCAKSVREFNKLAAGKENAVVLCISKDLPFAHSRFCTAEGIEGVVSLSEFRDNAFSDAYGLRIVDGPLAGLHSRVVIIVGTDGKVVYTEQVPEITQDPDFAKAIAAL